MCKQASCGRYLFRYLSNYGCDHCGFSFCGKCCNSKQIPGENQIKKLCSKCFETLTTHVKHEQKPTINQTQAIKTFICILICLLVQKQKEMIPNLSHDLLYLTVCLKLNQNTQENQDFIIQSRLNKLKEDTKDLINAVEFDLTRPNLKMSKLVLKSPGKEYPIQVSTEEIESKLAALKGVPNISSSHVNNVISIHLLKKKTEAEETANLLDQIKDEVEIDSHILSPEEDIQQRLNKLRGIDSVKKSELDKKVLTNDSKEENLQNLKISENVDVLTEVEKLMIATSTQMEEEAQKSIANLEKDEEIQEYLAKLKNKPKENKHEIDISDSSDEEDTNSKYLINKILAEGYLDSKCSSSGFHQHITSRNEDENKAINNSAITNSDTELDTSEELPWCSICNNDANLRCHDCDNDLYCRSCFKHCHQEFDLKTHTAVDYKPKK
ncbi:Abscission/NoCut checkpoint regulator [Nymphon striatum]|nr:Abscission/NoCut checkpoint regulator [Nymphon striatum]